MVAPRKQIRKKSGLNDRSGLSKLRKSKDLFGDAGVCVFSGSLKYLFDSRVSPARRNKLIWISEKYLICSSMNLLGSTVYIAPARSRKTVVSR